MQAQQRLFEHINDRVRILPAAGRVEMAPEVTMRARAVCAANVDGLAVLQFKDLALEQAFQESQAETSMLRRSQVWFSRMRGWFIFALVYLAIVYGLDYVRDMVRAPHRHQRGAFEGGRNPAEAPLSLDVYNSTL